MDGCHREMVAYPFTKEMRHGGIDHYGAIFIAIGSDYYLQDMKSSGAINPFASMIPIATSASISEQSYAILIQPSDT
ncbi:hypothetical protein EEL36_08630 [Muribaculaceae bacterium Isolate-043 (Harlan)]|nr:hypothetical protein EEK90_02780 [Muribaculaceae bacterium Isolate-036 (Harlan)]ROS92280.1 hypothetical protein EEL36_08630 [Muribaculaceae bacterium Isolate-043 (Harlan)]